MPQTMYTFRLHLWGVVLVALGAILVGVLLAVGGCLVGEWRVERAAAEGAELTAESSGASMGTPAVGAGSIRRPSAPSRPSTPSARVPGSVGSAGTVRLPPAGGGASGAGSAGVAPDSAMESAPSAAMAPVTYTVRLGSFGSQEEAQAFADQVTARGYTAAVVPDETSRGTPFFNVTVGSYATRWEARGAAREIQTREERRGWRATVTTAPAPP